MLFIETDFTIANSDITSVSALPSVSEFKKSQKLKRKINYEKLFNNNIKNRPDVPKCDLSSKHNKNSTVDTSKKRTNFDLDEKYKLYTKSGMFMF